MVPKLHGREKLIFYQCVVVIPPTFKNKFPTTKSCRFTSYTTDHALAT